MLLNHFLPRARWSYEQLAAHIGEEYIVQVTGPSGVKYIFQFEVRFVNEDTDDLEVEGCVFEYEGRKLLPPSSNTSFGISRDGRSWSHDADVLNALS